MSIKILVVDDEPDFQELVSLKFRKQIREGELQFAFAENGTQALEKLRQDQTIDIVLTDINMPEMDGLTLLVRLRETFPLLRSVVVSAYGDLQNIRTAMNRGAFDFLIKPIDFNDLGITINKTLQAVQQLKESLRLQQEKIELELRNQFIRKTFGRYVSDEVVEILLESPEALKLGGEKRKVTVLMSDLRGFTPVSERLAPEQVVTLLNRYFEAMVDIILHYGGTINEFIGDGMLVIFGAPLWREDDAQRAVACAVAMQLAMASINEQNKREGLPELQMGIGLNTGEVVAGNIGSPKRTKYGIVGRHVNLTSRIESFTIGGQVLISEATFKEGGSILSAERQIKMEAKGIEEPVTLHDLRGIGGKYDLYLPERVRKLLVLTRPLPARCTMLEGKHAGATAFTATFVKLSEEGGEAHLQHAVAPLSTLKIRLNDFNGNEIPADVYGKVMPKAEDEQEEFYIHFTSVPPEAVDFLRGLAAV